MNDFGLMVGIFSLFAVIAAGIIARLVVTPYRRSKWVERLLDNMIEPASVARAGPRFLAAALMDDALGESLVRHFEQSALSRQVLTTLAFRTDGMHTSEIRQALNKMLAQERKRELPASVVRRVVMILMGANLATLRQRKLQLTTAGRRLHALLQVRSTSALPSPAFASPSA
jgi:hypothetical protein